MAAQHVGNGFHYFIAAAGLCRSSACLGGVKECADRKVILTVVVDCAMQHSVRKGQAVSSV
jgi:hypothetical protein